MYIFQKFEDMEILESNSACSDGLGPFFLFFFEITGPILSRPCMHACTTLWTRLGYVYLRDKPMNENVDLGQK